MNGVRGNLRGMVEVGRREREREREGRLRGRKGRKVAGG